MKTKHILFIAAFGLAVALGSLCEPVLDRAMAQPAEAENSATEEVDTVATAMFGAGCFWGVEAAFRHIEGVRSTAVGYAGGEVDNPTYEQVCSDRTGHAEVVYIEYDPSRVRYEELLRVFWTTHDPTQGDRQGPDVGSQYRSVIFAFDPQQEAVAKASKAGLDEKGVFKRPITTTVEGAAKFWKAEEYHQQYLEKRGLSTCRIK